MERRLQEHWRGLRGAVRVFYEAFGSVRSVTVEVPYTPRAYFLPYHARLQRFAALVAHRRAGKTVACINDLQRRALECTTQGALFAYIAPTYSQAKSTVWDYLLIAAGPFTSYGAKINQSELRVTYPNGATVRLFGADNYDALRGLRLFGAVLDEYADFDPAAWTTVIRPALSDRRGFATFIGTPRGRNHFHRVYHDALGNPQWFSASYKAGDLVPQYGDKYAEKYGEEAAKEKGWLTSDELAKAKFDMSEERYAQEYECDFESANIGAYYGKEMKAALGWIMEVPYDPSYRVYTAWDIGGNNDATCIWFAQTIGRKVCLIDYYEGRGASSAPYAKIVLDKPYSYAQHFVPHDAASRHPGMQRDYRESLEDHGLRSITVLPRTDLEGGINAVRLLLPRCWFDAVRCADGVEALKAYQTEWDEKNRIFKSGPKHDWASHPADAFRYLAIALDKHVSAPNFNRRLVYPKGF